MLVTLLLAAALAQPLTIEDYATMPQVSSPRFSPDGNRIAYVVTRADLDRSVYDSDIWLVDADGAHNLQLTRGNASDHHPRWSPDGKQIAFLSDRGGKASIWLIGADGGEGAKLTSNAVPIRRFEWSPDGKSIAYTMIDPPTAEEEKRAKEKDDAHVGGENRKHSHLYLIDVGSRSVRRLTRGEFSINAFSWSPDGKQIAVERLTGTGLDDLYYSDLYLITVNDGSMSKLVVRPGVETAPRFSPDGKSIAFLSTGGVFDWLREHELHVMSLDDRKPRLVSRDYNRTPDSFTWSADSRTFWFEGPWNLTTQLFRVSADGSDFRNVSHADGMVTDINVDVQRSRVAFVYQTLTCPPEIHISSLTTFAPKQLTRHNEAYRDRLIGETRVIRWKNPKDGVEIEGLLTLPIGYERGKRYPLLVFVHGGPASRFDQAFLGYLGHVYPTHVFAARGFAVLRPNPRGTGGYGESFRQANRGDWGGMDWIDINAGIDAVIAAGVADPDRLGLMGWSYGGFMAAWAIGHSDRFEAISVGAPVVDLLSFHGTSDIRDFIPSYFPPSGGQVPAPAPPGATDLPTAESMRLVPLTLDVLREHSPLWHLKKTRARVFIQHGEADDRVPLSQGTMLYRVLDELGVDVTMVTYPRTPHVPLEPKLRIDVARRNVDFFCRVLLGRC